MHLSKQEFSKLSKKDKQMLMSSKGKQKPQKKPAPRKRQQVQRSQKSASVAAAYSTGNVGRSPQIKATRDTCNIKHRELLSNVQGTIAFNVGQSIPVQPGLSNSFPWLSIMAQGWEEYKFRSIKYCYYTRTGSTTVGSVAIAPDYDAADIAPLTEQAVSAYAGAVEDAPWKDIKCTLKASSLSGALGRRHFIRTGDVPANSDIKTYDVANVFVCTVDASADAIPWGKLWVEYDVDFYIPQIPAEGNLTVLGGKIVGQTTITAANPLGVAPVVDAQARGISVDGSSILTFSSPGTYLVLLNLGGTGLLTGTATNILGAVVSSLGATPSSTGVLLVAGFRIITSQSNSSVQMTATGTTVTSSQLSIGIAPTLSLS